MGGITGAMSFADLIEPRPVERRARLASPLRLRGKPEPEKFPRHLFITGAVVEPFDHVAE
jgi:hypothetical protein